MTLGEFKTFLEGYEHAFVGGVPNAEQWAVVKSKLEEVALIRTVSPKPPLLTTIDPNLWPYSDKIRYEAPPIAISVVK